MIRDRGKMKWQGFFMSEHTELLKKIPAEYEKVKKAELDEQELEEIQIITMESLNYTLTIKMTIWVDGFTKAYEGIVDKIDHINMYIYLETNDLKILKFHIDEVILVERV
ncbi:YolD-like family protein [Cytobacillus kochii]|uniref:YolD-like family protein n=1 Tax=Cytobacillus kochii TaxID=859143 RepID=UPI00203DCC60|nr:YolD-like family protein [Cytobacillus kochii]MCM3324222.1 YolD-like family protein [Cytobacillus kochii]MCM3346709.1 YolD-like family protein [Cytobacillus kochii]